MGGTAVLTRPGASFAARVAASLLEALDLPELITFTADEYETMAVELAGDPRRLAALKTKLAANRLGSALFDSACFVRRLEAALIAIHERRLSGLPPASIDAD